MRPTLVATGDSFEMTISRRTANFTYGEFKTILPEGLEQQETDSRVVDGYICRPDAEDNSGRFDFLFTRADVTIDMEQEISDLEHVVDTAQKRAEGETYFERDISGLGLGAWRPGIDYVVGDLVHVAIWGKLLKLPVTAIDFVGSDANPDAWRVHVGGQMISDKEALRQKNLSIEARIRAEKKERLRSVSDVRRTAQAAQATSGQLAKDISNAVSAAGGTNVPADSQVTWLMNSINSDLGALNSDMEDLVAETGPIMTEIKSLNAEFDQRLGGVINVGEELARLRDSFDAKVGEAGEIQTRIDALTVLVDERTGDASKLATEIDELRSSFDAKVGEAGEVQAEIERLSRLVDERTGSTSELAQQISSLSKEFSEKLGDAGDIQAQINSLSQLVDERTGSTSELAGKIDQLQVEFASKLGTAGEISTELANLADQISSKIVDQEKLSQDIADINRKLELAASDNAALEKADEILDIINNPVDIGGSLVPLIPGTQQPRWSEKLEKITTGLPTGVSEGWKAPAGTGTMTPVKQVVKVDPRIQYRVRYWARAAVAGTRLYVELRDQNAAHAVARHIRRVVDAVTGETADQVYSTDGRLINNLLLSTEWTHYEDIIELKPEARFVDLTRFYFQHTSGASGDQFIADLQIDPLVPDQAALDGAQNTAIRALKSGQELQAEINQKQIRWNSGVDYALAMQADLNAKNVTFSKVVTDALSAQSVINAKQADWNKSVTFTLEAQSALNGKQTSFNAVVNSALNAQSVINAKQADWNKSVTFTLEAQSALNAKNVTFSKVVTDALSAQSVINAKQADWNKSVTFTLEAQSALNRENASFSRVVTDALRAQSTINAKQGDWNKAVQFTLEAQSAINSRQTSFNTVVVAALDAQTVINQKQHQWNQAVELTVGATSALARATNAAGSALARASTRMLACDANKSSEDDYLILNNPSWSTAIRLTAKGTWTGEIVLFVSHIGAIMGESTLFRRYRVTATSRSHTLHLAIGRSLTISTALYRVQTGDGWRPDSSLGELGGEEDIPENPTAKPLAEIFPAGQRFFSPVSYWWPDFYNADMKPPRFSKWDQTLSYGSSLGIVILNRNSGQWETYDQDFHTQGREAKAQGAKKVIFYVKTQYGVADFPKWQAGVPNPTRYTHAYILQQIRWAKNQYSDICDGVFLDEFINGWGDQADRIPWYQQLFQKIKAEFGADFIIVGNPGSNTTESMLDAADILMTYERDAATYLKDDPNAPIHPYHYTKHSGTRFWHVIHGVTQSNYRAVFQKAQSMGIGHVYVTDMLLREDPNNGGQWDPVVNPYANPPSDWIRDYTLAWVREYMPIWDRLLALEAMVKKLQ